MIFYKHESTQIRKIHPVRAIVLSAHGICLVAYPVREIALSAHGICFEPYPVRRTRPSAHRHILGGILQHYQEETLPEKMVWNGTSMPATFLAENVA